MPCAGFAPLAFTFPVFLVLDDCPITCTCQESTADTTWPTRLFSAAATPGSGLTRRRLSQRMLAAAANGPDHRSQRLGYRQLARKHGRLTFPRFVIRICPLPTICPLTPDCPLQLCHYSPHFTCLQHMVMISIHIWVSMHASSLVPCAFTHASLQDIFCNARPYSTLSLSSASAGGSVSVSFPQGPDSDRHSRHPSPDAPRVGLTPIRSWPSASQVPAISARLARLASPKIDNRHGTMSCEIVSFVRLTSCRVRPPCPWNVTRSKISRVAPSTCRIADARPLSPLHLATSRPHGHSAAQPLGLPASPPRSLTSASARPYSTSQSYP